MKKLIVSAWISLDGYICGPNGEFDWVLSRIEQDEVYS